MGGVGGDRRWGRAHWVAGLARDVTARKEAEAGLRLPVELNIQGSNAPAAACLIASRTVRITARLNNFLAAFRRGVSRGVADLGLMPSAEHLAEQSTNPAAAEFLLALRDPPAGCQAIHHTGEYLAHFVEQGATVGARVTSSLIELLRMEGALQLMRRHGMVLAMSDPGVDMPLHPLAPKIAE